jgi:hypothetical protein
MSQAISKAMSGIEPAAMRHKRDGRLNEPRTAALQLEFDLSA